MPTIDGIEKKERGVEKNQGAANHIDFLNKVYLEENTDLHTLEKPTANKKHLAKIIFMLFLIFIVSGAMYISEILFATPDSALSNINKFNPLKQLFSLIGAADKEMQGEDQDRINFLFLGIGGEGHDGPYLTDTMIFASLKPSTKELALISLPRDMIAQYDYNWYKINSIYSLGKTGRTDRGAEFISQAVKNTLGQTVNYFAILDFDGFKQFIDNIDGIDVNVENGFTDTLYPTDDYQVTTVSFKKGLQNMDGERALIFARSRHGSSGENSDFARSKRQQLIIKAVKEKIIRFSTLVSPKKISSILELLQNHVETNLNSWEILKIAQLAGEIDNQHIYHLTLDDSPGNLLVSDLSAELGYILKPRDGNYFSLQQVIGNIFNEGKIKEENAKIEIQNGTEVAGLAYNTASYLGRLNYNVIGQTNALNQNYGQTVIYDLSQGAKPITLDSLKQVFQAEASAQIPSEILQKYQTVSINSNVATTVQQPDILIILGTDNSNRFKTPEPPPGQSTSTGSSTQASSSQAF